MEITITIRIVNKTCEPSRKYRRFCIKQWSILFWITFTRLTVDLVENSLIFFCISGISWKCMQQRHHWFCMKNRVADRNEGVLIRPPSNPQYSGWKMRYFRWIFIAYELSITLKTFYSYPCLCGKPHFWFKFWCHWCSVMLRISECGYRVTM